VSSETFEGQTDLKVHLKRENERTGKLRGKKRTVHRELWVGGGV